MFNKPQHQILP